MTTDFEAGPKRETSLPTELLQEAHDRLDDEFKYLTLKELDDTAMWAASGPVLAAATAGRADGSEYTVYLAAGIFAGSMMPTYINDGILNAAAISHWVNEVLPGKIVEEEAETVEDG